MLTESIAASSLDFNLKFKEALELLENSSQNIFITGQAGTGKSTLLRFFREQTKKKIVVLAPTGVAALNVQGQTIHSFFGFKPDVTVDSVSSIKISKSKTSLIQQLEAMIVDEISMVRSDLLDCMDVFLRKHAKNPLLPFGGVQMIFFGDLYQLPPVVTSRDKEFLKDIYDNPYFFQSRVFNHLDLITIELDQIYRQKDQEFIEVLGTIRNKNVSYNGLEKINARFNPNFEVPPDEFYVYLTTTNAMADEINQKRLEEIRDESFLCEGIVLGDFDLKHLPTFENLILKPGAQVMVLTNDPMGRWVNGSVGKVIGVDPEAELIGIELEGGEFISLPPFTWEVFEFTYNEEKKVIESESKGSFKQFPLRLAWALTIHKAQGKTFPKVVLDIGHGTFAHGQLYVALSRCTDLNGLVLKRKIEKRHILLDQSVVSFVERSRVNRAKDLK